MGWLIASNIGLLAAMLVLGAVVLSLARQIGVLHERTAPAGAAVQRARQAQPVDLHGLRVTDLTGATVSLGDFVRGRGLAILFVGPDCPVCKALLPGFERTLTDVALSPCYAGGTGPHDVQQRYATEHALDPKRYFIGTELAVALQVVRTPTLAVLDGEGRVAMRETLRGPAHLAAVAARLNRAYRPDGSFRY